VLQVKDRMGDVLAGVAMTLALDPGSGSVPATPMSTDANGRSPSSGR
jgi:hypothetical protein